MPSEKPLVYLILGATGSGRRTLVADLIDGGLAEGDSAAVLLAAQEAPSAADTTLASLARWTLEGGTLAEGTVEAPADVLAGVTHAFFVVDGRSNPIDQIEAFKPWLATQDGEVGGVICVVNCRLAEAHRELAAWYDACIYFSDIVVLSNREGVANKWLSDFQRRFKDKFYPCLFELLKNDRVKNPALLLEPIPRRMSHFFDEPEWQVDGVNVDDDIETGEGDDEEAGEVDDEVEVTAVQDPYMERRTGGRRVKELPDVAKFLDLPDQAAGSAEATH